MYIIKRCKECREPINIHKKPRGLIVKQPCEHLKDLPIIDGEMHIKEKQFCDYFMVY